MSRGNVTHCGNLDWKKKLQLTAQAGRNTCRDVLQEASAECKHMCNDLGIWVYILDNCLDPPDTTPWVHRLARLLDTQPTRCAGEVCRRKA
eukprot:9066743-Prorocentrum_lima.AAC.1